MVHTAVKVYSLSCDEWNTELGIQLILMYTYFMAEDKFIRLNEAV